MDRKNLTVIAISDLHYMGLAHGTPLSGRSRGELGRSLLKKVFLRLSHQGVKPDLVVLLGDLTGGDNSGLAELDLLTLYGEINRFGFPFLALRGNHDLPANRFNTLFQTPPGLYEFGGYGFVIQEDEYNEDGTSFRPEPALERFLSLREKNPDLPLVVLQHPPIFPEIHSDYPYLPINAQRIKKCYEEAGVLLSLSGHYHDGQPMRRQDGVAYYTVPALCKAPFRFSVITLEGEKIEIHEESLAFDLPYLMDSHCHTEHAFCRTTADTAEVVALSRAMGVTTLCFTEHAFQLYFPKKEALSFKWQSETERVERAWTDPKRGRMAAFKRFAAAIRSPFVKIGLELDLYGEGKLLLAPEDREGWDILIGSVHRIRDFVPGVTSQEEAEKLFLRDVEALVSHQIQVLAHPFRFFIRFNLQRPVHLYGTVADLLKRGGVAAEMNFHSYQPDPEFFRVCREKGVKIALGTDTHELAQAGEFWPHIRVLENLGIGTSSFGDNLFRLSSR